MMEPPVEDLLDRVDSKFTLVSLAAMRGRQINSYFNQLGEGLGTIVPPQVTSVSRKPLSISLEEIAAGKITYARLDAEEDAEAAALEAVEGPPSEDQPAPEDGPAQAQAGGEAEAREIDGVDDDVTDEVELAVTPPEVEVEREGETGTEPAVETEEMVAPGPGPEAEPELEVTGALASPPSPAAEADPESEPEPQPTAARPSWEVEAEPELTAAEPSGEAEAEFEPTPAHSAAEAEMESEPEWAHAPLPAAGELPGAERPDDEAFGTGVRAAEVDQ
jgi:DNA-directed RNA polymerase subunit omega